MELTEILSPDAVMASLKATSKKHLMQEIAQRASELHEIDARVAFEALLERERLGPTGVGRGVAIPHARLDGLGGIIGVFARCQRPVEFDAVDEEPVDRLFTLFAPEDAGANHLRALARVSRCLRDQAICAKLRAAEDASAIYAVLTESIDSRAA